MIVECPDCEKMISSEATSCPHCGHPNAQPAAPSRERMAEALKDKSNVLNGLDRVILATTGILAAAFALTANNGFFQWQATLPKSSAHKVESVETVLLFWLFGLFCTIMTMLRLAYRKTSEPSIGLTAQIDRQPYKSDSDLAMAAIFCFRARALPLTFLAATLLAAGITFLIMLL